MASRAQPGMIGGYECPDHGNFAPNAWCPRCKIEEAEARVAAERDRYKAQRDQLLDALDFEIRVLRDYQQEKGGLLGKLGGEIADALQEQVDRISSEGGER